MTHRITDRADAMNKLTFNPDMIWNKADPAKLPEEAKRAAIRYKGEGICLLGGAKLYFNRGTHGETMRGFWVKSYASSGIDTRPYCY